MNLEEQVYQKLKQVVDPETKINIVDMGFIYDVEIFIDSNSTRQVGITYTLTTPGCPLAGVIQQMIIEALVDLPWANFDARRDVSLQLTFDPPWTLDHLSAEARAELGY